MEMQKKTMDEARADVFFPSWAELKMKLEHKAWKEKILQMNRLHNIATLNQLEMARPAVTQKVF